MVKLVSIMEDGLGTIAKAIVCETAEEYKQFQTLIQRGANLWPDAPPAMKRLADLVTNGKVMQDYDAQSNVVFTPTAISKTSIMES